MEYSYWGDGSGSTGNWKDAKTGYLGIRKIEANDTCYGWISINCSNSRIIVSEIAIQKKK